MKTIFICTHCVLILTLITVTLLLINSALSLADSVDVQRSFTDEFKKSSFQENHYSAAIQSGSTDTLAANNNFNYQSQPPTVDRINDRFVEKSFNNEDELNNPNWDSSFVKDISSSQQQPVASMPEKDPTINREAPSNRDELAKLGPTVKTEQPATKRYMACTRDFGNITVKNKTAGDNGFKIKITGNPEKYTPGELYTVGLLGHDTNYMTQKFIGFQLLVEPKDPSPDSDVGVFQLYGDTLTKVSENCPTMITHTSTIPKHEIQVMWQAPRTGSGCVAFKATVIESTSIYYMDDGSLTRHMCEQETESLDEQPEILTKCCACDEAKFEMIFEGLWSKYTHPKEFPQQDSLTHFSEVIGASHASTFRMFEYGGYASEGLRQVAEQGVTKKLETELKSESDKIRTIIKARGLWSPNLNGKTFAVFRVDKQHHLMSLISKLGPSPDWIVGVSALELCLTNCSWVNEKIMNLYLWDSGTDSGVTYLSPNQPTIPQERIRRITPNNPSSSDSPFYDPSNVRMRPFARLTVTRQRLYEKSCSDPPYNPLLGEKQDLDIGLTSVEQTEQPSTSYRNAESSSSKTASYSSSSNNLPSEPCAVTDWTEWSECSVNCGEGHRLRTRNFQSESAARSAGCNTTLTERLVCSTLCKEGVSCAVTSWSEWSECSDPCRKGYRTRTRRYMYRNSEKVCGDLVQLVDREVCVNIGFGTNASNLNSDCSSIVKEATSTASDRELGICSVTQWSEWSPCSVSCGRGVKIRTRLYISASAHKKCDVELIQRTPCMAPKQHCTQNANEAKEVCLMPKEPGPCRGYFPRWFYDQQKGMCKQFYYGGCEGNKNNFEKYSQCKKQCEVMLRDFINAPLPSSTIAYAYAMREKATVHLEKGLVCAPISTLTTFQPSNGMNADMELAPMLGIQQQSNPLLDASGGQESRSVVKVQPQGQGAKQCPKLIQRRKCKNKNRHSSHNCIVRCRLQLEDNREAKHTLTVIKEIIEEEGCGSLYRGINPVLLSLTASGFVYFYSFHGLRAVFSKDKNNSPLNDILIGALAGCINILLTSPLYVVNTRIKMQKPDDSNDIKYNGMLDGLIKISQKEGFFSLWSGMLPSFLLVSNPSIQFMVYHQLKHRICTALKSDDLPNSLILAVGATAKSIATLITYPLQIIQTKLRNGNSDLQNINILQALSNQFRYHGIKGLYKGLESKLLQTVLSTALMYFFYEKLVQFIFSILLSHKQKSSL